MSGLVDTTLCTAMLMSHQQKLEHLENNMRIAAHDIKELVKGMEDMTACWEDIHREIGVVKVALQLATVKIMEAIQIAGEQVEAGDPTSMFFTPGEIEAMYASTRLSHKPTTTPTPETTTTSPTTTSTTTATPSATPMPSDKDKDVSQ